MRRVLVVVPAVVGFVILIEAANLIHVAIGAALVWSSIAEAAVMEHIDRQARKDTAWW